MKLYRFSPITSEEELMAALRYVHETCHKLCHDAVGTYLPVAGNIGIFCHDYDEYTYLTSLREKLTYREPNYKAKYYPLKDSIHFEEKDGIPAATYEYLYVRKVDPYRSHVGDVDFFVSAEVHEKYKDGLTAGDFRNGARLFERPEENLIELWLPQYDVVSFIANAKMQEKVAGKRADIAGVVVREKDGKYLMVQEKRSDVYGKWNLPAGRIDPGESSVDAAVREAREETGYIVKLIDDKPLLQEHITSAGRSFYFYKAAIAGGELYVDPNEVLDVKWCTFDEINQYHVNGQLRADVMYQAILAAHKR